ncbi:glutaredoxin domain-containing protein [Streptomyces cellulosae]|uniref:glutaredoxin domain-containing protein n=1 Tax=Streptomyces sp. MD20-1-1 TaxID=3028668 RepID=UPI0029B6C46E|nr:glutaredoxin domain-containing protein [Streptomyces sp. MD20-1-1]
MIRGWMLPLLLAAAGALGAAGQFADGRTVAGAVVLLVLVGFAVVNSPLVFPASVGAEEARRRSAADGRPVIYWRPGCRYCRRLRFALGRDARRAHWVDIWRDPAAAAAVRAIADGNETVPTVVLPDGRARVNPEVDWVQERL